MSAHIQIETVIGARFIADDGIRFFPNVCLIETVSSWYEAGGDLHDFAGSLGEMHGRSMEQNPTYPVYIPKTAPFGIAVIHRTL
jgi:hypothetical protein